MQLITLLNVCNSITNCLIINNDSIGGRIEVDPNAPITFSNNVIENNVKGLYIGNGTSMASVSGFYCNKFCNNSWCNILCNFNSAGLDLTDNYWCTNNSAIIASTILNGANVTYIPLDTTQCYLSGCNLIHSVSVTNPTCAFCSDGIATANVINGFTPYSYLWNTSPVQTTQTATGLSIGAYTVTITDLFGCTATENVVISAGNCSAQFNIIPDTLPQHYLAINMANGAAPLTYSWNWGDGTPNDFTPFPSHTYATAGYYTICLSIADANGCTNTYCNSLYLQKTSGVIYVSVVPPVPTGISEFISSLSYSIYPNPAADFITIVSPTKVVQSPFTIYNITGEQVLSTILTSQKSAIDISVISNGIYITELQNGTSNPRQKLLIEH